MNAISVARVGDDAYLYGESVIAMPERLRDATERAREEGYLTRKGYEETMGAIDQYEASKQ